MDYDEILDELGHFSKWHLLYTLLLWPCSAFAAIATMCYSFSGKSTKMISFTIHLKLYNKGINRLKNCKMLAQILI